MSVSVVGLFCEDIREERSGTISVIGILPDSAAVGEFPEGAKATIPKLCFYIRITFDPHKPIKSIHTKLALAHGEIIDVGDISEEVIQRSAVESLANGAPISTIFSHGVFAPFPIFSLGWVTLAVTVDDQTFVCAALKFKSGDAEAAIHEPERRETRRTLRVPQEKDKT